MPDVRDLLKVPDARIDEALAEVMEVAAKEVGQKVTCIVCGRQKKPIGRSSPIAMDFCIPMFGNLPGGCPGYDKRPLVGELWPGESRVEFGYNFHPPAYCSPDSPRRLLEEVEELIPDAIMYDMIDEICARPISWILLASRAYRAKAGLRARAALWVLARQRAEKLIAEVINDQAK